MTNTTQDFLLEPHDDFNPVMVQNHGEPVTYKGNFSTDLIGSKALKLIDEAARGDVPFFIGVAPSAPHSSVAGPPACAERHEDLFPNEKVPRNEGFNPGEVSKPQLQCLS